MRRTGLKPNQTSPDTLEDPAYATAAACEYLGDMHPKTLHKLARSRLIDSIQLAPGGPLRFRRSALNAFLARNTRQQREAKES